MQQCTHRRFSDRLSNVSLHTEPFIVLALRAAKALAVSLVAEMDGRVIGHLLRPVFRWDGHYPQGTVAFHAGFKADGHQPLI